jgi:soluble cytochrome b562
MNTNVLLPVVAAAVLLAGAVCPGAHAADLEREMEILNKAYKTIKKQVGDPAQKASTLEAVGRMKKAAIASGEGVPEMAREIPEAGRAKFLEDYKAAIAELVGQIDKLETAVSEGRLDDAAKELDAINESKRTGHSEFIKKDD